MNNGRARQVGRFPLIVLAIIIFSAIPVSAEYGHKNDYYERQRQALNASYASSYDWAISLNVSVLKKFLEYKDSKLFPVAEVDATVAVREPKTQHFGEVSLYETFWFHKEDGIGVSRERVLSLQPDSRGVVVIDDTPDAPEETRALCNAISRLLLDAHLLNSDFVVVAPDALFEQISNDLGVFRFKPITVIRPGQTGILLHMVSASQAADRYFWFDN